MCMKIGVLLLIASGGTDAGGFEGTDRSHFRNNQKFELGSLSKEATHGTDTPIDTTFQTTIDDRDSRVWPESVPFLCPPKSVKVKGTIDGVAFQTALMPWGNGTQFLPVSKVIRKAI